MVLRDESGSDVRRISCLPVEFLEHSISPVNGTQTFRNRSRAIEGRLQQGKGLSTLGCLDVTDLIGVCLRTQDCARNLQEQ